MAEYGPLTRKVMQYQDTVRGLVPTAKAPEDWAPLGSLITIDQLQRVHLEVQNWQQYTEMFDRMGSISRLFETTVRRISGATPTSSTSRSRSGIFSAALRTSSTR